MSIEENKTPVSWYIWLVLWVLPLIVAFWQYSDNPASAIGTWVGSGVLVILMIFKPKWVLPWFCLILIFDLIGYGFLFSQQGANVGQLIGSLLKELIFLAYLLISDNAKRKQGRLQMEVAAANET